LLLRCVFKSVCMCRIHGTAQVRTRRRVGRAMQSAFICFARTCISNHRLHRITFTLVISWLAAAISTSPSSRFSGTRLATARRGFNSTSRHGDSAALSATETSSCNGAYLLDLQVATIRSDAAPSRPVLYALVLDRLLCEANRLCVTRIFLMRLLALPVLRPSDCVSSHHIVHCLLQSSSQFFAIQSRRFEALALPIPA